MTGRRITLPIVLTPLQAKVDSNPARFKVLKWGRRTGKTWYEAYWLTRNAIKTKGKHWYVTKTLGLGREEFWPVLHNLIPRELIAKIDERSLSFKLTTGGVISIKSGEKEDNLRGRGLSSLVIDEAAFLKERLFDQILRPQLAESRGPALIASSPKKGWFTRLYNQADSQKDATWYASHATIYDNPRIGRDEIEIIKAKTPDSTWRQEYMAEELSNVGQVYEEFSGSNIYAPATHFPGSLNYPTVVGIDYGHWDFTGAGWIGFSPEGYAVISRSHKQKNWDVQRHAAVINTVSAGFNITQGAYVLDRTAFRKEATSMTSISDLFSKEGIRCHPSEKDVTASVDIVKRFVRGDGIRPWLYVSSECPDVIEGFQEWEHDQHEPDLLAAIRYGLVWAVRKRLTRLGDAIPLPRLPTDFENQEVSLARGKTHGMTPPTRWAWDYASGVPK